MGVSQTAGPAGSGADEAGHVKDLRSFLDLLAARDDEDLAVVERAVRPDHFDVTALLENLDRAGRYPAVVFARPRNMLGKPSDYPLVSNIFATRERCALALDFPREEAGLPLSLEYARREAQSLPALVIPRAEGPVAAHVITGGDVDIGRLPIVRHHEMDLGPVLTMTVILKDPDDGFYDISFIKTFYRGPREVVVTIHSPHLERILAKYEQRGQRAPFVNVLGHHPAFFLGSLGITPFGTNDYDAVGAFLGEPLRLTPSQTWGDEILVPADAEIVLEGEIVPGERAIADPFGEVTRHYQAQCLRPVGEVTAITYRNGAIMQDIFPGHRGHWNLGGIPKEGSLFNSIEKKFGGVCGVHMPYSGCSRFACYVSIEKKCEGRAKMVGMEVLAQSKLLSVVVVVDEDIDPFNEADVIWAALTQTDPERDVTLIKNAESFFFTAMGSSKLIIDATRPVDYAFPATNRVPVDALQRMCLDEWLTGDPAPAGM
jgi:UbiD family decarboxylase